MYIFLAISVGSVVSVVSVGSVGSVSFGRFGVSVESTEPNRYLFRFGSFRWFGGSVVH